MSTKSPAAHPDRSLLARLRETYPEATLVADGSPSPANPPGDVVVLLGDGALPTESAVRAAVTARPSRVVAVGPDPYPTADLLAAAAGARLRVPEMTVGELDTILRDSGYAPVRRAGHPGDTPLAQGGVFAVLDHARVAAGVASVDGWLVLEYAAAPAEAPDQWVSRPTASPAKDLQPAVSPFLSVLIRTQGADLRLSSLRDALTSLQGQTCQDFEVLVLPHNVSRDREALLADLVGEFSDWFGSRVRIVPVTGGGRAAPLAAGARAARGEYIVALDDDDIVLGHWVETFADLVARAGRQVLLRSCAVAQPMEEVRSAAGFRSSAPWVKRWASDFDTIDQLVDNQCPIHTVAFPRAELARWNLWWNDDLPVLEDWDLLMRAAQTLGVISTPTITAVYRLWPAHHNSFSHLPEKQWESVRAQVLAGWDQHPLVLPLESATRLRDTELFRLRHRPWGLRVRGFAARKVHETRVAVSRTPFGPAAKRAMRVVRWVRASY